MSLEEQIKQSKFKSEREKAIVNISFTHSYLSNKLNSALKCHAAISMQQYNVLRILKGQHPNAISVSEITARMVDKMSNTSRLIDKLFAKNLIERKTCTYDKRQLDIVLTEEGADTLITLNNLVNIIIEEHNALNDDEYKMLNELLNKFRGE
jgi:DNA-binding MarR family transcriptional regulator